uniref:Uncharacterized protein n=1 Tax=Oryza nivara TaxID=4536 RepID=A0A0E0J309_ORYNI
MAGVAAAASPPLPHPLPSLPILPSHGQPLPAGSDWRRWRGVRARPDPPLGECGGGTEVREMGRVEEEPYSSDRIGNQYSSTIIFNLKICSK